MPGPCRCRICKRMDWETHALLAELARGEELTQGETLRAAVRAMARSRGLLGKRRDDAYKRRAARDRQRAPIKDWIRAGIYKHPSPRHPDGNGEAPVLPRYTPASVPIAKKPSPSPGAAQNGRNRHRALVLLDWEAGYLTQNP